MSFEIYTAQCSGKKENCSYPFRYEITDENTFKDVIRFDHVCAAYKDSYRKSDNFLSSNVVVMDCDNDHTEDPTKWVTLEKAKEIFKDYSFAISTSRSHLKEKGGNAARPRFHIYFEISPVTDQKEYAALKKGIYKKFPFFDKSALDSARFIFGIDESQIFWNKGWLTIDDTINQVDGPYPNNKDCGINANGNMTAIHQGSRNSTMSAFAAKAVKRFGATEKGKDVFMQEALKCDPPLPIHELNTIWESAVRFFSEKIANSKGYVSPDSYNPAFGNSLKPKDYSDIGEAKTLADLYSSQIRYSPATDFIRFDGKRWIEDSQFAIGAVQEFLDRQLADAKKEKEEAKAALSSIGLTEDAIIYKTKEAKEALNNEEHAPIIADKASADKYYNFVMRKRDYRHVIAIANTVKPMISVDVKDLDKNPFLLNTPDGTYDLRKGIFGKQPHHFSDLITKITTCSPSKAGEQLWTEALNIFFCNDQELIDYVQMVVGMAAFGKVYQEHLVIAYGDGANGKSTFWNTIFRIFGDYAGKLSAEALTTACKRNVKPEMAELKGRRLIISSELEEGMRLNTAIVKQLCSTDEIQAEKKYKAPFHFVPSHTLVLYTNHLPKVGVSDDGLWRRVIVIPFNAKITGNSDIKNYADHLCENAGGFIMAWIIEGAQKVFEANFKTELPQVVKGAIEAYREENNWLGHFLEECCLVDKAQTEKSGRLYTAYRAYCSKNGEFTRSMAEFYAAMENAGFNKKKTKDGMIVYGLKLNEELTIGG